VKNTAKGRQSNVGHVELSVVAGAPVRQSGGDRAQAFDEMIEARARHAPRNDSVP
jgi:hypothetical protein